MRLYEIHIKGFKSFADQLVLRPSDGITAIVGPNGSGKSNLVDSIRWVLGEQKTRILRSDKMESIIFNGSVDKKPLQMAEVSLTFDNTRHLLSSTHSEVRLTRRLYRSGESEYELNGVRSRLKDIQGLLMDSGLGANGYSIIELKMVDDLLHDTQSARKNLFNQVAGITRFHQRKHETYQRLSHTEEDITRIEDVLAEIKRNVKTLKGQAAAAEKYQSLSAEYQSISAYYITLRLKSYSNQVRDLETQLSAEQSLGMAHEQAHKRHLLALEAHKNKRLSVTQKLENAQRTLEALNKSIQTKEKGYELCKVSISLHGDKIGDLETYIKDGDARISGYACERTGLTDKLKDLTLSQKQKEAHLKRLEGEYASVRASLSALESSYQEVSSRRESFQLSCFELERSQVAQEAHMESLGKQKADQNKQRTAHEKEIASVKTQLAVQQKKQAALQKSLKASEAEVFDRETQFKQALEVQAKAEAHLQKVEQAKQGFMHELQLIEKMESTRAGFNHSVRFLHEHADWGEKKAPLLCDIIRCAAADRPLVERALAPYLQYHVVETRADARLGLTLLAKNKVGEGAFFILDEVPETPIPPNKKTFGKALMAYIQSHQRYQTLLNWLTRRVRVVDNDAIPKEAYQNGDLYVDRQGHWTSKQGRLEGGKVSDEATLLSASLKEELKAQIAHAARTCGKAEEALSKAKQKAQTLALNAALEQKKKIEAEYDKKKHVEMRLKMVLEQLNEHIKKETERLKALGEEESHVIAKSASIKDQLTTEKKKHAEATVLWKDLGEQLKAQKQTLQAKEAPLEAFRQAYQSAFQARMALENQLHLLEEKKKEWVWDKERNQLKISELKDKIKAHKTEQDALKEGLAVLYGDREQAEASLRSAEAAQQELGVASEDDETGLRAATKKQADSRLRVGEIQGQIQLTKGEIAGLKERFSVEFPSASSLEAAAQKAKDDWKSLAIEELKIRVDKTRETFSKLGAVNPLALESYRELKQRYEFIEREHNDLIEARSHLEKTISELNTEATKTFKSAFEEVKKNFKTLFADIFGHEDLCDIALENPSQPLTSAVRIIAQPRGKKPISIEQLSSGEKTLTAIALLFAAYLCKPAPFCILDEIDAPLDDANTAKFNELLRKLSKKAQFLIVTHNKHTMKHADMLYGMTMLEKGISRVLPVRMEDMPA